MKVLILGSITEGEIWFCLVGGYVFTEKLTHELKLKSQKVSFKLWLCNRNSLLLLLSSWQPCGLYHVRLPWPSPSPGVCSDSCPLSWWCYLIVSSFAHPWLFTSGGQSIRTSATVLPMNIQGWFPLGSTGAISWQSKGLSRVFSNTFQKHQFFSI